MIQPARRITAILTLLFSTVLLTACDNSDWRTASREPAGIALSPLEHPEAVIEVYGADAFGWRGWFAIHTWIAVKPREATDYTVYEIVAYRLKSGLPALREFKTETPDRYWFGAKPEKLLLVKGEKAEKLIPKLITAVNQYPYANEYTVFPGPNSNTFPAWISKQLPELDLELPFRAIGKNYIN